MIDRRWFAALKDLWRHLSSDRECGRIERCSMTDRLRDDIGLTERETKSASDWINETTRKHIGHY
jgi:hypothetical protein